MWLLDEALCVCLFVCVCLLMFWRTRGPSFSIHLNTDSGTEISMQGAQGHRQRPGWRYLCSLKPGKHAASQCERHRGLLRYPPHTQPVSWPTSYGKEEVLGQICITMLLSDHKWSHFICLKKTPALVRYRRLCVVKSPYHEYDQA